MSHQTCDTWWNKTVTSCLYCHQLEIDRSCTHPVSGVIQMAHDVFLFNPYQESFTHMSCGSHSMRTLFTPRFQFWSLGNDIWGLPCPHTRASLITQPSLFIIPLKECWRFLSHFSYHWGPLPKSVPLWATAPLHLRAAFDTEHMDNPQIIGNRVPSLVFHPGD